MTGRPDMMSPGPFGPSPVGLTAMTRAWRVPPLGVRLVRETDAAAFVVDVAVMLKLAGRDPVITAENERWLHRLGALMLDRFGLVTGREATEENDDLH